MKRFLISMTIATISAGACSSSDESRAWGGNALPIDGPYVGTVECATDGPSEKCDVHWFDQFVDVQRTLTPNVYDFVGLVEHHFASQLLPNLKGIVVDSEGHFSTKPTPYTFGLTSHISSGTMSATNLEFTFERQDTSRGVMFTIVTHFKGKRAGFAEANPVTGEYTLYTASSEPIPVNAFELPTGSMVLAFNTFTTLIFLNPPTVENMNTSWSGTIEVYAPGGDILGGTLEQVEGHFPPTKDAPFKIAYLDPDGHQHTTRFVRADKRLHTYGNPDGYYRTRDEYWSCSVPTDMNPEDENMKMDSFLNAMNRLGIGASSTVETSGTNVLAGTMPGEFIFADPKGWVVAANPERRTGLWNKTQTAEVNGEPVAVNYKLILDGWDYKLMATYRHEKTPCLSVRVMRGKMRFTPW